MSTGVRFTVSAYVASLLLSLGMMPSSYGANPEAQTILSMTGVQGGLVVHVGCGDGTLTATLRANDSYVVQGLDRNPENVAASRAHLQSLGLYGPVSAELFDGVRLPYLDNMVNLLVVEEKYSLSDEEMMRVLTWGGTACIRNGSGWVQMDKGVNADIDEWTHYLHDPQGTTVSKDKVVGQPRGLQWVSDPKWLRNHDFMSSLNGMVSAQGRLFYIIDEGERSQIYLPSDWKVVARDAFNGKVLWKRTIPEWVPQTIPFKSGPGHLPRRIVAVGDKVYVTLGLTSPSSQLDAATGEVLKTYPISRTTWATT